MAHSTEKEVEGLVAVLQDNSEDWKPRMKALGDLIGCAESCREHPESLTKEVFALLRVPLKRQLEDLRSQIVREACKTVTKFAVIARDRSRELISYTIQQIINVSGGANKVMAGFAADCMRQVVASVQVHKAIAPLCELCTTSRNKAVVESVIECIYIALAKWERFRRSDVDLMENAIEECISAASSKARSTARLCFWAFHNHYSDRGDKMLRRFDTRTHGLVMESKAKAELEIAKSSEKDNAVNTQSVDEVQKESVDEVPLSQSTSARRDSVEDMSATVIQSMLRGASARKDDSDTALSKKGNVYTVGDRVLVTDMRLPAVVCYVGTTQFAGGTWVGCALTDPAARGKNSGSVQGVKYFDCAPNKGLFVRPGNLVHDSRGGASAEYMDLESVSVVAEDSNRTGKSNDGDNAPRAPEVNHALSVPVPPENDSSIAGLLLSAHRAHVDKVLECLRNEMLVLAEFEKMGSDKRSPHEVAEYASSIAESMHMREQMLEQMYQKLGSLCSSLAIDDAE